MKDISQLLHFTGSTCWSPSPGLLGEPSPASVSVDDCTEVSALWFDPLTLGVIGFCCVGAGGEFSSVSLSLFIFLTSGSTISSLGDKEGDGASPLCCAGPDAEIPKSDPAFRFLICPMKCILMWSFNLSTDDSLYPQRIQQKSSDGEDPDDAELAGASCVLGDLSVVVSCVP